MPNELAIKSNSKNSEALLELSSFFELLARFDYEDKQKERSRINTDSLASVPKGSMLELD